MLLSAFFRLGRQFYEDSRYSCSSVLNRSRLYTENISALAATALQLATRPETSSGYMLRLYPLSLERSALLAQLAAEEDYAHETVRIAYEEERDRVEEEWRKGRERIRERMLEGVEERRRRAREEKDGEGITGMLKWFTILINY